MQPSQPGYPQQQAWPQGQQQQQWQQPYGPQQYTRQPSRNIALIVIGAVLLLLATLSSLVFAYNAYDYANVDDNFKDLPDAGWIVDIVKEADMHRMIIFGVIAAFFGLGGLVCAGLGLRKT